MPEKPHICLDARLLHATGIGTFLKLLLHFLSSTSYEVSILILDKYSLPFQTPSHWKWITCKSLPCTLYEHLEIPQKIPPCDLFWAPHFNTPFFAIPAKKRLSTIHDAFHLSNPLLVSTLKRFLAKKAYQNALNSSHFVTTISQFSKNELKKHFPHSSYPLQVIPLCPLPHFSSAFREEEKQRVRRLYNLPKRFLFSLGNFRPHKNLNRLLEAYAQSDCEEHLLLVGPASLKAPRVHVIPHVPDQDLPIFYSLATALVFPSLYEGFGLPPLEAMACGCPVITSKTASLPEVCGEAAEYIDPHSILSIRKGIEHVCRNEKLRNKLIADGYKQCRLFSFEAFKNSYSSLLQEVFFS